MSQNPESYLVRLNSSGRWESADGTTFTSGHPLQICFEDNLARHQTWLNARFEHHPDYGGYYIIAINPEGTQEIVTPYTGLRVR